MYIKCLIHKTNGEQVEAIISTVGKAIYIYDVDSIRIETGSLDYQEINFSPEYPDLINAAFDSILTLIQKDPLATYLDITGYQLPQSR